MNKYLTADSTDTYNTNADVNEDGYVDKWDFLYLAKYLGAVESGNINDGYSIKFNGKEILDLEYTYISSYSSITCNWLRRYGDVDCDGDVDEDDYNKLYGYIHPSDGNPVNFTDQAIRNSDINDDFVVDEKDLNSLRNALDKNITLPVVGDVNGDGNVDENDLTKLAEVVATTITNEEQMTLADIDRNGVINQNDLNYLKKCVNNGYSLLLGDVDNDGKITREDRIYLKEHMNEIKKLDSSKEDYYKFLNADIDLNGKVDDNDLKILTDYVNEITEITCPVPDRKSIV